MSGHGGGRAAALPYQLFKQFSIHLESCGFGPMMTVTTFISLIYPHIRSVGPTESMKVILT